MQTSGPFEDSHLVDVAQSVASLANSVSNYEFRQMRRVLRRALRAPEHVIREDSAALMLQYCVFQQQFRWLRVVVVSCRMSEH
jgi:hypothetical protein